VRKLCATQYFLDNSWRQALSTSSGISLILWTEVVSSCPRLSICFLRYSGLGLPNRRSNASAIAFASSIASRLSAIPANFSSDALLSARDAASSCLRISSLRALSPGNSTTSYFGFPTAAPSRAAAVPSLVTTLFLISCRRTMPVNCDADHFFLQFRPEYLVGAINDLPHLW
jgi:hypothetical protein